MRAHLIPRLDHRLRSPLAKTAIDGTKSDRVTILQLSISDKIAIDLCPRSSETRGAALRPSDDQRLSGANQLIHYKTNSFAIQNQAIHLPPSSVPEGRAAGAPNPPLTSPRRNHKAPWHSYGVCGGIWFD